MNLYYIKCLMFTKSNSIKIKCRIDRKINTPVILTEVLKS